MAFPSSMTLAPEDFPQTWQRPGFEEMASLLRSLQLSPPVWGQKLRRDDEGEGPESPTARHAEEPLNPQRRAEMITRYLSSIIKSPLAWIDDDDQKEELWELASKRMSERCGRNAMGEMTRRWPFPGGAAGAAHEPFDIVIREPALTGDSLGLKTWGSSYVLAQHLPQLAATSLFRLFDETLGHSVREVLELGSGTGLLGIAAAALWKATVYLSDLPTIMPNLEHNVQINRELVEARGGRMLAGALTWGGQADEVDRTLFGDSHQFKLVIVADPLYDDCHPTLLASAIGSNLCMDAEARAVVMVPRRDKTTEGLLEDFKNALRHLEFPLRLELEEELAGQDDWTEDEESGRVRCWLGIFSRGAPTAA